MLNELQLRTIIALRHRLHECPERSGNEHRTLEIIREFLTGATSLDVQEMDGWLLATHREDKDLPTIGFRAELDAIPVEEAAGEGTHFCAARHGCGHDGHCAILCGLGLALEGRHTGRNVQLIFQAAEETGEGAKHICGTWPDLNRLSALYALHNIPGFPRAAVLMRRGCFACASCGHIVHIKGRPAHAAYPGDGTNPIELLSRLALATPDMIRTVLDGHDRLLMRTLIALQAGSENFGLSASEGRLSQTLRGYRKADIDALIEHIQDAAESGCREQGMHCDFEIRDEFPDTANDDVLYDDALSRFARAGLSVLTLQEPMRWSEDFGWYLKRIPGLYFGIGAGEGCPGLHTEAYAFDDRLIEPALRALEALL